MVNTSFENSLIKRRSPSFTKKKKQKDLEDMNKKIKEKLKSV